MKKLIFVFTFLLFGSTAQLFATIITTGDIEFVSPPPSVRNNVYESNNYFRIFSEFSGTLSQNITADIGGTIKANTVINCYFVHSDIILSADVRVSPAPDVKANGFDTLINITSDDNLLVTVVLNAGSNIGLNADWWVAASTPFGWYYFDVSTMSWVLAGSSYTSLSPTHQGILFNLSTFEVLNMSGLPTGTYIFYFAVDSNMNGSLVSDKVYADSVTVAVTSTTCTYSISPTSQTFSSDGGTGNVNVIAPSGCNWTAISNTSWITITSGNSGSGNGTVVYSASENTSSNSRTGTITSAGQIFTVVQDGSVDLSGTWKGSASSSIFPCSSQLNLTMSQNGNKLTGSGTSIGNCTSGSGTLNAEISGSNIFIGFAIGGGSEIKFNGTISGDQRSMSGSYDWPAENDRGTWLLSLQ